MGLWVISCGSEWLWVGLGGLSKVTWGTRTMWGAWVTGTGTLRTLGVVGSELTEVPGWSGVVVVVGLVLVVVVAGLGLAVVGLLLVLLLVVHGGRRRVGVVGRAGLLVGGLDGWMGWVLDWSSIAIDVDSLSWEVWGVELVRWVGRAGRLAGLVGVGQFGT